MHLPLQILCLLIISSVLFPSILAYSQAETQSAAVITFTIDFPTSQPEHYSIRVQSDGSARYQSSGRFSPDSDQTDSFDLDFTVGADTRQKIFEMAGKAGYFQKDLASRHKDISFTGKKTLTYQDSRRRGEAPYHYSPKPAVQGMTKLLHNLSP